ncbi:MAG TPA: TIGR03619 family F420-dependent LLM class oxidoreductase [Candidatus Limnocylindria bacterium]|nr:TIGR03619 family F420-dependent LLM class oxidoreductase [Candidatus Limnocylindria bacterium]
MRFGVGIPTCREGTAYPVPYVRPEEFVPIGRRAEELGFHSLWANDHLTTPYAIRATQDAPPNFYEPIVTYAAIAAATSRLRLMLGVVVLPEREIILLAKQIATLDQLSRGRIMLGVGIGSYREEFEAVHPDLRGANRGRMMEEGIEAFRALCTERRASYHGKYIRFEDVELAPKPAQSPFPILINAHEDVALRRVGRIGDGWVVAGLDFDRAAQARAIVDAAARAAGRDPASIELHFQTWLSFGVDQAAAEAKLKRSQHWRRLAARDPELSEAKLFERYRAGNLLGGPDDVVDQVRRLAATTGAGHIGVVFLGETTTELLADMELFSARVMPAFA